MTTFAFAATAGAVCRAAINFVTPATVKASSVATVADANAGRAATAGPGGTAGVTSRAAGQASVTSGRAPG